MNLTGYLFAASPHYSGQDVRASYCVDVFNHIFMLGLTYRTSQVRVCDGDFHEAATAFVTDE